MISPPNPEVIALQILGLKSHTSSPMALDSTYPPKLSASELKHLVSTITDWSIAHGLAVKPAPSLVTVEANSHAIMATAVPVTLFPSPFPRSCFEQACAIQRDYNALYATIAQDEKLLQGILEDILLVDEFIAKLWQVHLQVKWEGYVQDLSLGLFRSDYMVHQQSPGVQPTIKQVEFNTIASSFGGLSVLTSVLHGYLARGDYLLLEKGVEIGSPSLPPNETTTSLARGIKFAFEEYVKAEPKHECCVIFVVQTPERNIFDQRHLEYALCQSEARIPVFRLPFSEILEHTELTDTPKRELLYRLPTKPSKVFEVAVVYFRAGYGPSDYPDDSAWKARLHIERSYAIKCPSVLTQLAGAKKVQQVLATPMPAASLSILNQLIPENHVKCFKLADTFANIYPLDDSPAGLEAQKLAMDPELCKGYVLKPQREGGGNNKYRTAIPPFLASIPRTHWKSYILMEIITPPPVHNHILRNGTLETGGIICELGVYGTCLWDQAAKKILHNEQAGYLLRTKGDKSEEGGVAAGFGCMDSCFLI